MLVKKIKYTDFDGNERTEEFHFNLTKAELFELQLSETGGIQKAIEHIIKTQDHKKLMDIFKNIITSAYGEKSVDGKRFVKSKELTEAFMQTNAYSELFMELAQDADSASAFINGIMPKELSDKMTPEMKAKALADAGLTKIENK